jgi:hypothetical protein
MMAMAKDESMPTWRNFAAWSLVGAIFTLAVLGGFLLVQGGGMSATLPSGKVAAVLGLTLILATIVTGFSGWKRPVSLRTFRNYLVLNVVAASLIMSAISGFSALARAGALGAMSGSKWAAGLTGLILAALAVLGILAVAGARMGAGLIDDQAAAEDMRERWRLFFYSFLWMAACGLLLILLGLAGPEGVVPRTVALAGVLLVVAILGLLGIATRRLSDELVRTLSNETGNMAFLLILLLGGGWAMLAHLGFVAAPAPLDWLTLFIVLMFVASFIAAGRRKLLTR